MEWSRKRCRDFLRIADEFTAEEMEVAEVLLSLCHFSGFFVQWGAKRRRSAIFRDGLSDTQIANQSKLANCSPVTPLGVSWSESEGCDPSPSPSRRLPSAGNLNSKNLRIRNSPRRRPPKKKTHKELKDMVNTLSLERNRLKKKEEKMLKTYEGLRDWNNHLKAQLASCLEQRQEQKPLLSLQPTSSDQDSGHETETFVSFNDSLRPNEHDCSDSFPSTLALGLVYDEPRHCGKSIYSFPLESSSGSEKGNSSRPAMDPSCFVDLPDLNAPIGAMCDVGPNGFHEQMLLTKNKVAVAAEARRRRIELTRVKYGQSRKFRSR